MTDAPGRPAGISRRHALTVMAGALGAAAAGAGLAGGAAAVPPPHPPPSPIWLEGPGPGPDHPDGVRPLPACRYRDVPAAGDPDRDWATMVLDTVHRLPADFVPRRLVSTSRAGMAGGFEVIPAVIDDLRALHEASIQAGAEIQVRWAYRSYAEQSSVFRRYAAQLGKQAARAISARPGHSEHQLGTTLDFRSADSTRAPWDYDDWGTTKPGRWMGRNAWRFGFVLSYPRGETAETCYAYEPWHYRYVGREVAAAIEASGLSPRRYLWETYAGRSPA